MNIALRQAKFNLLAVKQDAHPIFSDKFGVQIWRTNWIPARWFCEWYAMAWLGFM